MNEWKMVNRIEWMNRRNLINQIFVAAFWDFTKETMYLQRIPTYNLLATVYASILAHIRLYIHNNIIYYYPLREIYDGVNNNNNNKIDT